jgi:hypothetical protein
VSASYLVKERLKALSCVIDIEHWSSSSGEKLDTDRLPLSKVSATRVIDVNRGLQNKNTIT